MAQNTIMFGINLVADVTTFEEQDNEPELIREFSTSIDRTEEELDDLFRNTCRRVAIGYAWLQSALRRSGKRTFLPAMRRFPAYEMLPAEKKSRIETEIKYIRCIYENWGRIVTHCTLPIMTGLDVRPFPLWKLSKCIDLNFVEKENNKGK